MNETKTCMVGEGRGIHRNQQNKKRKRNWGTTPRHNVTSLSQESDRNFGGQPSGKMLPTTSRLATFANDMDLKFDEIPFNHTDRSTLLKSSSWISLSIYPAHLARTDTLSP